MSNDSTDFAEIANAVVVLGKNGFFKKESDAMALTLIGQEVTRRIIEANAILPGS
jgi:hypothetical protein